MTHTVYGLLQAIIQPAELANPRKYWPSFCLCFPWEEPQQGWAKGTENRQIQINLDLLGQTGILDHTQSGPSLTETHRNGGKYEEEADSESVQMTSLFGCLLYYELEQ